MLAELRRAGVGTDHVIVRDDLPTGMSVALSRGGDRAILTAPGGISALTAADIPAGLLSGARRVHVSSYFLMEERLGPGLPAPFAAARAVTSLDTNWDPSGRWAGRSCARYSPRPTCCCPTSRTCCGSAARRPWERRWRN